MPSVLTHLEYFIIETNFECLNTDRGSIYPSITANCFQFPLSVEHFNTRIKCSQHAELYWGIPLSSTAFIPRSELPHIWPTAESFVITKTEQVKRRSNMSRPIQIQRRRWRCTHICTCSFHRTSEHQSICMRIIIQRNWALSANSARFHFPWLQHFRPG
jgi:hypothetical protein